MLNDNDKNNIKIFKHFKNKIDNIDMSLNETNQKTETAISKAESFIKKLGLQIHDCKIDAAIKYPSRKIVSIHEETYEEILEKANKELGEDSEYYFEDILSSTEIASAYNRVREINSEFSQKTRLTKIDLAFLTIATGLQTLKWILLPEIGHGFNSNERMDHDDPSIKQQHKETLKEYRDEKKGEGWEPNKNEKHPKSWIEILFTNAPYDKIKGSSVLGLGLSGKNHRLRTLGHDPILGWVFGTASFMTDTATLSDFSSYRIRDARWAESVPTTQVFKEAFDLTMYDKHCLAAALVAQGAHLASDKYTKMGLPIPFLSSINEDMATKIYSQNYDVLCLQKDLKIIGMSAAFSLLINMIVGFVHRLFYKPSNGDMDFELYKVRTSKILLISNTLASSSNIIYSLITSNPHRLDIGGIIVTLSRLFLDFRFMAKVKEEFIQNQLNKDLEFELNELDNLYNKIMSN